MWRKLKILIEVNDKSNQFKNDNQKWKLNLFLGKTKLKKNPERKSFSWSFDLSTNRKKEFKSLNWNWLAICCCVWDGWLKFHIENRKFYYNRWYMLQSWSNQQLYYMYTQMTMTYPTVWVE